LEQMPLVVQMPPLEQAPPLGSALRLERAPQA
jgi:hypothetical protein